MTEYSMDPFLHMRTTFIAHFLGGLVLFVCLFHMARSRKIYPGFTWWTAGTLLYSAGYLLFALRGTIPDLLSILMGDFLIILSFLAIPYGLVLFTGRRESGWPYLALVAATMTGLFFFMAIRPDVNWRIVILSVPLFYTMVRTWFVLKSHLFPLPKESSFLLFLGLALAAPLSVARVIYTFVFESSVESYLSTSNVQILSNIGFHGCYVLACLGLCILNFQRVEFELKDTREDVKTLEGILPICASCKKIRDDQGYWRQVEAYIQSHSEAVFSHSICPECVEKLYPELAHRLKAAGREPESD